MNPYNVTKDFEAALCEYTGAKYVVAVNSCTAAIQLAVLWHTRHSSDPDYDWQDGSWTGWTVEIPKCTYPSVPMSIRNAKARVKFLDIVWIGAYQLKPLPVWDCARRMTSGMYVPGQFQCVSHSSSKILGVEQGGCILHDNDEADPWFRRMRFDGRTEGVASVDDNYRELGLHCIMLPSIAAQLLLKLSFLPKHNEDLPVVPYPDLSKFKIFHQ